MGQRVSCVHLRIQGVLCTCPRFLPIDITQRGMSQRFAQRTIAWTSAVEPGATTAEGTKSCEDVRGSLTQRVFIWMLTITLQQSIRVVRIGHVIIVT